MIVVDASLMVDALVGEAGAASRLEGEALAAPHLLEAEAAHVLRRLAASGVVDDDVARLALTDLAELEIYRFAHGPLLARVWELRTNLTAYDALYVALAEHLEIPLVTADGRLARSPGIRATVEVVPGA